MIMLTTRKRNSSMDTVKELETIKWVAEAEKFTPTSNTPKGFVVTTQPHMLKIKLTEKIFATNSTRDAFGSNGKLKKPIELELPRYKFLLEPHQFWVALVDMPKPKTDYFGITPQYHDTRDMESWSSYYRPCYGENTRQYDGRSSVLDYRDAKDWKDKANIVAVFLQTASPHYGREWWRTDFAYRLGLVGDEVIDKVREKKEVEATMQRDKEYREAMRTMNLIVN